MSRASRTCFTRRLMVIGTLILPMRSKIADKNPIYKRFSRLFLTYFLYHNTFMI
jgi:hypothetical protein